MVSTVEAENRLFCIDTRKKAQTPKGVDWRL